MINEIDYNKYIVIKSDDIKKYLSDKQKDELELILLRINNKREYDNKNINKYLVLNINDDFDVRYFINILDTKRMYLNKIKDISIYLVNSILRLK